MTKRTNDDIAREIDERAQRIHGACFAGTLDGDTVKREIEALQTMAGELRGDKDKQKDDRKSDPGNPTPSAESHHPGSGNPRTGEAPYAPPVATDAPPPNNPAP